PRRRVRPDCEHAERQEGWRDPCDSRRRRQQLSRSQGRRTSGHHRRSHAVQRTAVSHRWTNLDLETVDRARRTAQLADKSTVNRSSIFRAVLTVAFVCACAHTSLGQTADASSNTPRFDDEALSPAEPDFTLIDLPTALRVPTHKSAFRVTHRFLRPLGDGDLGDLVGDAFGLDNGAQIGLEYRYGIIPNGQIGVHRTSDKTIEFFAQYGVFRQGVQLPVEVAVIASTEGGDNFKDAKTPSLGAIVSRRVGKYAAFYVEP